MQPHAERVIGAARTAPDDDIDIVRWTHAMQATVGDEERDHQATNEYDLVEKVPECDGGAPDLLRVGMIEVNDHAASASRCRRCSRARCLSRARPARSASTKASSSYSAGLVVAVCTAPAYKGSIDSPRTSPSADGQT